MTGRPAGRGRGVLLVLGLLAARQGRRDVPTAQPSAGPPGEPTRPDRPHTVSGIEEPPRWRSRWAFYAVGAAMMGWGLYGLLTTASTKPLNWASFFVGGVVAHDLVFLPLLALVVVLALHRVPARYRSYVQAGVLISGLLTLVTLPMVLSPGRPDDPSTLPLPYARNLFVAVAVVWVAVLVTAAVGRRNRLGNRARGQPRAVIE